MRIIRNLSDKSYRTIKCDLELFLIILISPLIIGGSCEKRSFSFISDVKQSVIYENLEINNSYYEVQTLNTWDIRRALEIPRDGKVTDVFVRGFGLRVIPTNNNTTDNITTSCVIIGSDNLRSTLWEKQGAAITSSGAAYDEPINDIVQSGVDKLKIIFEEALLVNEDRFYKVGLEIDPGFGQLSADVNVIIDVQVEYKQCIEMWDYLDGGDECK